MNRADVNMTSDDPILQKIFDASMKKLKESPIWNSPSRTIMSVELTQLTIDRLTEWENECNRKAVEKQKAELGDKPPMHYMAECWELGYPYTGAIGIGITWEVTETSIGQIVKARYDYIDEIIDLTEYDLW